MGTVGTVGHRDSPEGGIVTSGCRVFPGFGWVNVSVSREATGVYVSLSGEATLIIVSQLASTVKNAVGNRWGLH